MNPGDPSDDQNAEARRELLEQIVRLRTLVDAAFEGIGISRRGIIIDLNEQLTSMLGYERAELIGTPVAKIVAPESLELVQRAIESGHTDAYQHMAIRKDGTVFPVEVRGRMLGTGAEQIRLTAVRDITARRKSESHLKTLTERFKLATDAASIAIWDWDLATNEVTWDERMFDLYGMPREPGGCVTFDQWAARVHPDDLAAQQEMLQQTIREKRYGFREFRIIRPDGSQRHIQAADAIITNEIGEPVRMVGMNIDISERKNAEQALRESEDRFRAVVESSPDCIAVAVDERVAYLNPAGQRMFAITDYNEVIGRSVYDFVPPEYHEEVRTRRKAVLELGLLAAVKEGRLLRMDGSLVSIEALAVPFVYAGRPAIMNLIRDISPRKRLEEERAEAVIREQRGREEFTRQLIASQEAERRRISAELHDSLGQNLLLIKNRAQLALAGIAAGTDAHDQLQEITALTTASIGEVRQISLDLHPYQLDHLGLTGALEAMIDNTARSSGLTFERRLDQVDDVFGKDAAMNLYRIVQESLSNVLKHSGARQCRVLLERDVREIILRISDDGSGFDAVQSDSRGLGMRNITERVRMLGGRLAMNSSVDRGTCLEVTIPIPGVE